MNWNRKSAVTMALLLGGFSALAVVFSLGPAKSGTAPRPPLVPKQSLAIDPGTIRISAGQLMRGGGDASGLDCYACHHQESPPQITVDADHRVILPKEHADLIIGMRNCAECHPPSDPVKLDYDAAGNVVVPAAHKGLLVVSHGKNFPGGDCYNCHNRDQLNELHTPEGTKLKFDQATLLCASCHGRIYRDWNAGAHGRTSGHWDPKLGPRTRQECTSCHDPHAPAFTSLIPMPGPHLLHPVTPTGSINTDQHEL